VDNDACGTEPRRFQAPARSLTCAGDRSSLHPRYSWKLLAEGLVTLLTATKDLSLSQATVLVDEVG
jgi:hypothetical protein